MSARSPQTSDLPLDLPPRLELDDAREIGRVLDAARRRHYEDGDGALVDAIRCHEAARALDDAALRGRALALQAAVMLQRGDLRGAFQLASEAAAHAERASHDGVRAELAAVRSHLSFFAGSYAESLAQAQQAIELADRGDDVELRIFVRRSSCMVFGNVGVRDWPEHLLEVLRLAVESGDRWEEAMSRNDLAHLRMEQGDPAEADREMARAVDIAAGLPPHPRLLNAVLACTRADMRLRAGRADEALADARRGVAELTTSSEPNPYVLAMTVVVEVQALLALGRLDEAERSGRDAVARLGDRVPQARGMILGTVATALREAGRTEDAFDVLAASTELERRAFAELTELQRGLERALLETSAARRQADALSDKNRELERAVRELGTARATLERRTAELEDVEQQLREQADRDWLTGLHNRRYLARELERHAAGGTAGPFSLVVLDLDHFKAINDRFGHDAGDQVLRRVAALLLGELRSEDAVIRTGGEEFVLVMPATGAEAAAACCARLLATIREERWSRIAPGLVLTASMGVATTTDPGELPSLGRRADHLLYEAKRAGRDRVATDAGHSGDRSA
jgi:two-component system cell cycle response regulator